jgi:hypothetical protein
MSNLSQFFALGGGNKIKKIQTVTASQTTTVGTIWRWDGVTASISAVDTSKTLLICSPSNNSRLLAGSGSSIVTNFGHGAYLYSSTEIRFHGPEVQDAGLNEYNKAFMVVQVVEFE